MSDWSVIDRNYPSCSFDPYPYPHYPEMSQQQENAQYQPSTATHPSLPTERPLAYMMTTSEPVIAPKADNPRELRNKAEKNRRDKMNQSISRLASIVPPVVKAGKKVDKTSVLRLTAHYLRSHRHVFSKSMDHEPQFSVDFTRTVLKTMKGFLLTATYKGLVVVVSPNIQEYLGYSELELLGQNLFSIVHKEDHKLLKDQLFPKCCKLTSNGELLLSKEPDAAKHMADALKNERREFIIRFKKLSSSRSEPAQYLTCHVEGTFRKADRAGVYVDNSVQIGRRVRSRGNNPYASGNDIVFVGMIRPITETFATESRIEAFTMEYRTRHSIDGGIIQCEQRICLITGYMISEVKGVNAMNFMHRDDVRWVIVALREMYVQHRLMGESCYRLMTKNGEFIYMQTKGVLDVDPTSKEATSFLCTNTVVPEKDGIELIKLMKKKFALMIDIEEQKEEDITNNPEVAEEFPSVEDPKDLEQAIYHLVTDLPSHQSENSKVKGSKLTIIPPSREEIKEAIQKSNEIIKTFRKSATREKYTNMGNESGKLNNKKTKNKNHSNIQRSSNTPNNNISNVINVPEFNEFGSTQAIDVPRSVMSYNDDTISISSSISGTANSNYYNQNSFSNVTPFRGNSIYGNTFSYNAVGQDNIYSSSTSENVSFGLASTYEADHRFIPPTTKIGNSKRSNVPETDMSKESTNKVNENAGALTSENINNEPSTHNAQTEEEYDNSLIFEIDESEYMHIESNIIDFDEFPLNPTTSMDNMVNSVYETEMQDLNQCYGLHERNNQDEMEIDTDEMLTRELSELLEDSGHAENNTQVPIYTQQNIEQSGNTTHVPIYTQQNTAQPDNNMSVPTYTQQNIEQSGNSTHVPIYTQQNTAQQENNTQVPIYTQQNIEQIGNSTHVPTYTQQNTAQQENNTQVPIYTQQNIEQIGNSTNVPIYAQQYTAQPEYNMHAPSYTQQNTVLQEYDMHDPIYTQQNTAQIKNDTYVPIYTQENTAQPKNATYVPIYTQENTAQPKNATYVPIYTQENTAQLDNNMRVPIYTQQYAGEMNPIFNNNIVDDPYEFRSEDEAF